VAPASLLASWSSIPSHRTVPPVVAALVALILLAGPSGSTPVVSAADPPWDHVEAYYLRLVNCTRTGGWVLKDGTCKGYGTGRYSKYVPPLKLSAGISSVARSWAKNLAVNDRCTHGDPAARLRRAGYTSYRWAENIGCRDGYSSAMRAVLATHRFYQSEKVTNGGHWRTIKNPVYRSIGIGVWRASGRTRLVTDFYAP